MRRSRGTTLLELVVVGSLFLAVAAALWMIRDATVTVEHNLSSKVDLDREIFAAVRHLDACLRECRLVQPSDWYSHPQPVTSLELQPLRVDSDGQPVLTAQGTPAFGTAYTIVFQNEELVRPGIRRRLARLGHNGRVSFLRTSQSLLEMNLQVEKTVFREQTTSRQLTFKFSLFNQ
ncbi:MAG: hypothetical protein KF760_15545 [Candidatus Eremiobacteraeota bacterium]|nr:hypothetical protein [Candidatus Eremiobacteraeota bacterium]MCW5869308.1 hypothetical protein [Candidatus Eremiobacteraeota bacterium]